jgi:anti-sigma factor RsiW
MCEFSGKLVAWLDHELPFEEAAEVERHLEGCSECRGGVDAYKRASGEFGAYCDEIMESQGRRGTTSLVQVAAAIGAVAAIMALILSLPRTRVEPPAFHRMQTAAAASPAIVSKGMPAVAMSIQAVHRHHAATPVRNHDAISAAAPGQEAYAPPEEPAIQIAISADEMFPPGAVPEGMHFVADLTIAADGSAERLRLSPRLAGIERSTNQP